MKFSVKHILVFIALLFGAYAEFHAQQTITQQTLKKKKIEKNPSTLSAATSVRIRN